MDILTRWAVTAGGYVLAAFLLSLYVGAKEDLAAEKAQCNADKLRAIAEAEEVLRMAKVAVYERRIADLESRIAREAASTASEREKRIQAEVVADERKSELDRLAQEAFDEDDIPDSNACLNAFLSSRALRCVLHSRNNREAGAGGSGEDGVCTDPGSPDGAHPGFSNITYADALKHWGSDRDGLIRWNERATEIEKISGGLVNGLEQD